ncbi:MAG: hypothetical protein R3296_06235 [Oleiphilaceae bacterium]|nr:hypothetical protein [Oleiphilaceae bacterium]
MKSWITRVMAVAMLSLALPATVVAEDELDVTMEMVRDDESLKDFVAHELPLPKSASETGREASGEGRARAAEARETGREKAEEARERAREAREQRGRQLDLPPDRDRGRGPSAGGSEPPAGPDTRSGSRP